MVDLVIDAKQHEQEDPVYEEYYRNIRRNAKASWFEF